MAASVMNIAKGRVAEFYNRVDTNDPANSALIVVILATSGLEADAVLIDKDTLTDVLAGTTNEVTNVGYARKVLTDTDLSPLTADDTNNRMDLDIVDLTWTAVAAGDGWSRLVICYDPDTTTGTDATIIPLTLHDFVATPSGADITAQINSAGFYRAA